MKPIGRLQLSDINTRLNSSFSFWENQALGDIKDFLSVLREGIDEDTFSDFNWYFARLNSYLANKSLQGDVYRAVRVAYSEATRILDILNGATKTALINIEEFLSKMV